jgi:GNAT superfamily N-acetyltransferase
LIFRTAYWHDRTAREAFKQFIREIHGVDFDAWDDGYWDDDYRPYSYFEGERVAASMCIYTMPAIIHGERVQVAQVSGVGTLAAHRLKGLNRRLHETALAETFPVHRFAFLYADDEAVPFYRKLGFRPVRLQAVVLPLPEAAGQAPSFEKLDLGNPAMREVLYKLAAERAPISRVFSTHNPKLVMYHLLYRLRDFAWHVPALDAVLLMKPDAKRPVVYDILAAELPRFEALAPILAAGGAREAEFRFPTDLLQAPPGHLRELEGANLHVMGDFPFGEKPVIPFTSQA